jgi:hypothetical protein
MAGSGTTLVEARLLGRHAWASDIDPLARLIAKVKATPVALDALDRAIERLDSGLRDDGPDTGWRPDIPNFKRWFRPGVARDLARIRRALLDSRAPRDVRDVCWVAFSSLITARTSVANVRDLVHSRHHHRRWTKDPRTRERYVRRLRRMRAMLADFGNRLANAPTSTLRLVGRDARALPLDAASVDLVFTSPPYCSALDYTRAHMFSVAWMSDWLETTTEEYRALGRTYIGSERAALAGRTATDPRPPRLGCAGVDEIVDALGADPRRAWIVARYFAEMQRVLAEAARVLRPGGAVVLVVCPSNIRRLVIPTHEIFAALATTLPNPLEVELLVERTLDDRRRLMPYLEASFGPRMRTEYVLVLRRAGARA